METKYFVLNNKYNYNDGKKMHVMSYLSSNANFMTMSNKMILEEVMINAITFLQRIFIALYQFLKEKFMKTKILNTDNRYIDTFYVANDVAIKNDPCDIIDVINVDILSTLAEIINNNFKMELKQQQSSSPLPSASLVAKKKYWPVGINNKKATYPPLSPPPPPLSQSEIISPTPEDPFENELSTTSNVDVGLKVVETNHPTLATKIINDQDWTPHQMIKKPSS
jgi:hypothetical protein